MIDTTYDYATKKINYNVLLKFAENGFIGLFFCLLAQKMRGCLSGASA